MIHSVQAEDAMVQLFDQMGETLSIGQKVWVDMPHMANWFPGAVMFAEVIEGYRDAQPGMIWVRQLPTAALPNAGEEGGWVSEQHASRCLGR
jgi:hypothetical protein